MVENDPKVPNNSFETNSYVTLQTSYYTGPNVSNSIRK